MTGWRVPQNESEKHAIYPESRNHSVLAVQVENEFGESLEPPHAANCPGCLSGRHHPDCPMCVQLPLEDLREILRSAKRWVDYAEAWEARHGRR